MIDFLDPRSKKIRYTPIPAITSICLVLLGVYLVYTPLVPVISHELSVSGLPYVLPANLEPETQNASLFQLPVNKVIEQKVAMAKEEPQVLGVSYTNEVLDELTPQSQKQAPPQAADKKINRIIIPRMGVDTTILEGDTETMLWQGVVRMDIGSKPEQGGNTIITAHRYLHTPGSAGANKSFYNIHMLETGDTITVEWGGSTYVYAVDAVKVVDPTAVEILHNSKEPKLTLFSCTPIFTSEKRHVVTAKLVSVES
jgi:LPXTG-site transpeptidase (sortase) family protein